MCWGRFIFDKMKNENFVLNHYYIVENGFFRSLAAAKKHIFFPVLNKYNNDAIFMAL